MTADNILAIRKAELPTTYMAARVALATCERIDECQAWADKAAAMASYAKQIKDDSLLTMATRIKARAVKRVGVLLDQIPRPPKGGRNYSGADTVTQVAKDAGLSKRQRETCLRVAKVPDESFERQVESAKPPTVTALAAQGRRAAPPRRAVDLRGATPEEFAFGTHVFGALERACAQADEGTPTMAARGERDPARRRVLVRNAKKLTVWLERLLAAIEKDGER